MKHVHNDFGADDFYSSFFKSVVVFPKIIAIGTISRTETKNRDVGTGCVGCFMNSTVSKFHV